MLGSLFGEIQHGHLDQVGFDTYTKLLEETILELKGEEIVKEEMVTVDLNVDAYVPDKYVKEQKFKMDIYQTIVEVKENSEMKEVISSLEDRYGKMPKELKNFIKIIILRNMAKRKGISKILELKSEFVSGNVYFDITDEFNVDSMNDLIINFGNRISFKEVKNKKQIVYKIKEKKNTIKEVHSVLQTMYDKEK